MKSLGTTGARFRDLRVVAGLVVLAVVATVLVGVVASARSGQAHAESGVDGAPTVSCPGVVDRLPAVPAQAAGDVEKELGALQAQINEANNRLATSAGQGGPNFIDNAILGPLEDKRVATLERIEIAIGRHGDRPTGLVDLATCTLADTGDGAGSGDGADPGNGDGADAGNGNDAGNGEGGDAGNGADAGSGDGAGAGDGADSGNGDGDGAGTLTVDCPSVDGQLAAIPAQAAGDVERELTALQAQINEANNRLATSAGQGGPNFIDNAILGPLEDKRVATLERIEIAIGRHGDRPTGLVDLATCTLSQ